MNRRILILGREVELHLVRLLQRFRIKCFTSREIIDTLLENYKSYDEFMQAEIPLEAILNLINPLLIVEGMRKALKFPIGLTSTYRTFTHNANIGGVRNSLHLQGLAIDCQPQHFDITKKQDRFKLDEMKHWIKKAHIFIRLQDEVRNTSITESSFGIGFYNSFIHIDTRGLVNRVSPVFWH